jgi:hypothetical protein
MSPRTRSRVKSDRSNIDAALDEALARTFPASDPFSVGRFTATEPPLRPVDRKAPRLDPSAIARAQRERRLTG